MTTYSVTNLQVCPICLDDDRLINTSYEHTTIEGKALFEHKVKVLNCNHKFHHECISKFFFEGGTNCPCCRTPIGKNEKFFAPVKDPYSAKYNSINNENTFISKNENGNFKIIFDGKVSKEKMDYILKNQAQLFKNVMKKKPDITLTIPVNSLNQFISEVHSINNVDYLVDENGICHPSILFNEE